MTATPNTHTEVLANYQAQLEAMAGHDVNALGALLTEDFTLTHITGYVQPRSEWLSEMAAGQFRYHTIEPHGQPQIAVIGNTPRLTHRIITDATVYGSRNRWRLVFTQTFRHHNTTWLASQSVATTW